MISCKVFYLDFDSISVKFDDLTQTWMIDTLPTQIVEEGNAGQWAKKFCLHRRSCSGWLWSGNQWWNIWVAEVFEVSSNERDDRWGRSSGFAKQCKSSSGMLMLIKDKWVKEGVKQKTDDRCCAPFHGASDRSFKTHAERPRTFLRLDYNGKKACSRPDKLKNPSAFCPNLDRAFVANNV